jgi:hypothetical protein
MIHKKEFNPEGARHGSVLKVSEKIIENLKKEIIFDTKVFFDSPRFRDKMHLPVNYPGINQYQQWFTVEPERTYSVSFAQTGRTQIFMGRDLIEELPVAVRPGETLLLNIREIETTR